MRKWLQICGLIPFFAFGGCSDDGRNLPDVEGYAVSPDDAVRLYRRAYQSRDLEVLGRVLSPEFVFEMHPDDADSLDTSRSWPYSEELAVSDRIFRLENGVRIDGTCQPPPSADIGLLLNFDEAPLGEVTSWVPVGDGPYRGAMMREFGLSGQLLDANGLLDFFRGRHRIYARQESIPVDGRCCIRAWRLVGWKDLGVNSSGKHGVFSWGRVKARWRSDGPDPIGCP